MRKVLTIAGREYKSAVQTKSFLISLLVLPLMMGGSVVMQRLLRGQVDTDDKHFAIIDRTPEGVLYPILEAAARQRNEKDIIDPTSGKKLRPAFIVEKVDASNADPAAVDQKRLVLSDRIRSKELFGFMEIGARVLDEQAAARTPVVSGAAEAGLAGMPAVDDNYAIRYQSNSPTFDAFQDWAGKVLNDTIRERRFTAVLASITGDKLKLLLRPVPVIAKGLTAKDRESGKIKDAENENKVASFLVPGGLMAMMFLLIMVGATPLMQGVIEEKMQRIAEVLLGSVTPFQMMMGKLLGMVGVSLSLGGIYLGGAYWALHYYGFDQLISASLLLWFVIFLVLSVLMFGSLFIAVGAACTDLRETQAMLWPVMLLIMMPMFVWVNVLREPNSAFSTWISFFPFATPILMTLRQAVPPGIAAWQPILGVAVVLLTTLLCVYAAGRIFRVGILLQGKGARPAELLRWIWRG